MPTYRTAGAWGPGSAGNLTPAQVDGNFYELRTGLDDVIANPPAPNSIETIEANGFTWTVTLTDGTVLDPLPVPVVYTVWRGDWAPATLYHAADQFRVDEVGIFAVMADHTSAATFDPAAIGGTPPVPLYLMLIEVATLHSVSARPGDYTLAATDADAWIRFTGAAVVTIPDDATLLFVTGTTVAFEDAGGGGVEVAPAAGVTLNVAGAFSPATNGQFAVIQIKKVGPDEWTIYGNLAP